jgi:hypothetical protein
MVKDLMGWFILPPVVLSFSIQVNFPEIVFIFGGSILEPEQTLIWAISPERGATMSLLL